MDGAKTSLASGRSRHGLVAQARTGAVDLYRDTEVRVALLLLLLDALRPGRQLRHVINPLDPGFYGSEDLRSFGFAKVGEDVRVSKDCTVIGPERISFGDHVRIDSGTCIVATGGAVIFEGRNHIGGQCHFSTATDLMVRKFAGISQGVRIYTGNDDYLGGHLTGPTVPADLRNCTTRPIEIGRHAIVGAGCVMLPGADIGEGSVIGALSVVTRPVGPWGVYAGTPARWLKERRRDLERLEEELERRSSGTDAG